MKHLGPFVHPPRQDASPSQATPLPLDIFSALLDSLLVAIQTTQSCSLRRITGWMKVSEIWGALLVKASRKTKLQVVQRSFSSKSEPSVWVERCIPFNYGWCVFTNITQWHSWRTPLNPFHLQSPHNNKTLQIFYLLLQKTYDCWT